QGARVDRRRVVDPGPDAQGGKMPGQPVPNRRNPERILMIDVGRAPRFPGDGEPVQALQPGRQRGRVLPPPGVPLFQPRELPDPERPRDLGHAVVAPEHLIGVLRGLAHVDEAPRPLGPGVRASVSATRSGSRLNVWGSMSANTGTAPRRTIAFAVATNENGVVTTRAPGRTSAASSATSSAADPEEVAAPCAAPTYALNACSNSRTRSPATRCPESNTSSTRRLSSSEI